MRSLGTSEISARGDPEATGSSAWVDERAAGGGGAGCGHGGTGLMRWGSGEAALCWPVSQHRLQKAAPRGQRAAESAWGGAPAPHPAAPPLPPRGPR